MTREELITQCLELMAYGSSNETRAARLADLLWELTGKTPEPPKRTRGMEIAEKVVRWDMNVIVFVPTKPDSTISIPINEDAANRIRQYLADAIDAAEPQVGHLPVIEWRTASDGSTWHYLMAGGIALTISEGWADHIVKSCGFPSLSDYPNLKERKS